MRSIKTASGRSADASADALARSLFDEAIAPAAAAERDGYFPFAGEPECNTYFVQAGTPRLTPTDFEYPGGGDADGLIDALVEHWAREGDDRLAALGDRLKDIVSALRAEAVEGDGDVDPYCYTMF